MIGNGQMCWQDKWWARKTIRWPTLLVALLDGGVACPQTAQHGVWGFGLACFKLTTNRSGCAIVATCGNAIAICLQGLLPRAKRLTLRYYSLAKRTEQKNRFVPDELGQDPANLIDLMYAPSFRIPLCPCL